MQSSPSRTSLAARRPLSHVRLNLMIAVVGLAVLLTGGHSFASPSPVDPVGEPMVDPVEDPPIGVDPLEDPPVADPLAEAPVADPLAEEPVADPPSVDSLENPPVVDSAAVSEIREGVQSPNHSRARPMVSPLLHRVRDACGFGRYAHFSSSPIADP